MSFYLNNMRGSSPIRVAIVAASIEILGGHAVQAQRMLDGWREGSRVDAWLVPINPVPRPPFNRLSRIRFLRTLVTQACYWPLLVRELRRADVVHVFSASYFAFLLATVPAVMVARLLGKPVVVNYHSGEAPDHLNRSALARRILRHSVDLVVVPSAFLREVFASFGISAAVVTNTLDLAGFPYRERTSLRPRLLSTRNFEPLYNVACTLRAFARIQARHPEATLTLVGSGSQETALRNLASQLRLRHVSFAGRVPPADIQRYYAESDIYIQSPAIDNMPLSLLEAFASGCPVVSTRVGGVPYILTHDVQGLLIPPDDEVALADAVTWLLAHPERARQMAASARASCEQYTWSIAREGWLAVYESVLPPSLESALSHEPV